MPKILSGTDLHTLLIGVAGGLVVFFLLGIIGVIRSVGWAGLLTLRRSLAQTELTFIEVIGNDKVSLLAHYLGWLATTWAAAMAVAVANLTFYLAISSLFHHQVQLLALAIGTLFGLFTGMTISVFHITSICLRAIRNFDGLVSHLRSVASRTP
jgi:hypothetical protein